MKTVKIYKGIALVENDFGGYLSGEGRYAVHCGNKKFVFKTIKEFKDAVNAVSEFPVESVVVPFIENDSWGNVPLANFRNFVQKNLEMSK